MNVKIQMPRWKITGSTHLIKYLLDGRKERRKDREKGQCLSQSPVQWNEAQRNRRTFWHKRVRGYASQSALRKEDRGRQEAQEEGKINKKQADAIILSNVQTLLFFCFMNIWELCKCAEGQICPFCKILLILGVMLLSGLVGYLIGRRKNKT